MSNQQDDLLLSLQSSLRNSLHTFGPSSPQYASIKALVDEQEAKVALRAVQEASSRQKEKDGGNAGDGGWGGKLAFRVKRQ